MRKNRTYHKKKTVLVFAVCVCMLAGLMGRMVYLMVIRSDYYAQKAEELHERERDIKAARGRILDAKGEVLADNKAVCTISVIHSQTPGPTRRAISPLWRAICSRPKAPPVSSWPRPC